MQLERGAFVRLERPVNPAGGRLGVETLTLRRRPRPIDSRSPEELFDGPLPIVLALHCSSFP
jgi:hypothetical protein